MSSYIKRSITCRCCKKEYQADILKGYTAIGKETGLDTNPHDPNVYNTVVQCPNCGYSTMRLYDEVNNEIKAVVNSPEFQSIVDANPGSTEAKLQSALVIAERDKKYKDASYYALLLLLWHQKDIQSNEITIEQTRTKTIKYLELHLDDNADEDAAIVLIDLLRQSKRFDEATETLDSLEPYIADNKWLENVVSFEKKLVSNKDARDHRMGEVTNETVI